MAFVAVFETQKSKLKIKLDMKHGYHTTDELGNNDNRLLGEDLLSSLKASELRIGNLVDRENTGNHVKIHATHLVNWEKMRKFLFPLKLTDEWFMRFGFEWKNNGLRKNNICVRQHGGYYCIFLSNESFNFAKKLEYVHQLQNLDFTLTGEELTS